MVCYSYGLHARVRVRVGSDGGVAQFSLSWLRTVHLLLVTNCDAYF